jgi:hypothetical protein
MLGGAALVSATACSQGEGANPLQQALGLAGARWVVTTATDVAAGSVTCTVIKHPAMATFIRLGDGTTGVTFGPDERTVPGSALYLLVDGTGRMETDAGAFRLDSALEGRLRRASTINLSWRALRGDEQKQAQVKVAGIGAALDRCASRVAALRRFAIRLLSSHHAATSARE